MERLTASEAEKHFEVTRQTLRKHLENGKISGVKDPVKGWQIDPSELARVYTARGKVNRTGSGEGNSDYQDSLKDQIELLKNQVAGLIADKNNLNGQVNNLNDQVKFLQGLVGARLIENKSESKSKKGKDKKPKKGKRKGKK